MKNRTLLFLLLLASSFFSQNLKLKGTLLDKKTNKPIVRCEIQELSSTNFTTSNNKGTFEIELSQNKSSIVITHLNYQTRTIEVRAEKELTILLEKKTIQLEEVLVQGSRLENISHTEVVTDDIKRGSQIRNTAELFNDIPGFSLQKRSSTAVEPSFRSFKYEEMNLKFDGGAKMVHACPNRMDPMTAHMIPEEVNKIEVIKGPYTVRFGQRFGPTVNIVTKVPVKEDYGLHGKISTGFETNGDNLLGRIELMHAQKEFDLTVNGESRKFSDYTDGNNVVVPSGFQTDSYSVKLGINKGKKQRIQVDWRQKFGKDIKHAGLPMDSPKDDSWLLSADYKYTEISKKIKSFTFKTYTSYVDHLMSTIDRPSFSKIEALTPVQSQTYGGKMEFTLTPSDKTILYIGADADVIARQGEKNILIKTNPVGIPFTTPIVKNISVWQGALIEDYGIFTEGSYNLNDYFTTTVGIRTDYVLSKMTDPSTEFLTLYGGEVDDKIDVTVGGNLALKYLKNNWRVQLAYGRGTRTASMVERYIYRFAIGADPRDYIGNPNLKPEVNNQFEISVNKQTKKLKIGASVYYSIFEDYITARINSSFVSASGGCGSGANLAPKQFWNVDAKQHGFEAYAKYKLHKNLNLSAAINYTKAYNESFNEPLAQISPLASHINLKWETSKYWLDLRAEYVAAQDLLAKTFGETKTPSFYLFDFRAGIKPTKDITIGGAVLNLLNETYYNHLNFSYINSDLNAGKIYEAGRSFSLFAKYQF